MKKLPILIIAFLISLSVCVFASTQVKAADLTVAVSPTSWVMDVGQSKTFTALASGGSGNYTGYQWLVNGVPQSGTASTFSYTPASANSYVITVYVTDDSNATTSSGASVTVNSALVAPTVSASLGTVTQGQTSSLTSSAVTTGTAPYTYQWLQKAPGGSYSTITGATSSSYSFVTSSSTTPGSWSFDLQVTDATSAVVTSSPVSVTVNAAVALTVAVSPTSWVMDVGQSKTFTALASGGSGNYTGYQWLVNGVPQSGTASTFSYTPASANSYLITVTVTDSFGTTSAQSSASSVSVSVSPTVSIVPIGPVTLNVGQVQVFTATSSGGSGSLSYQWYLDGGAVGSNSASYSYTAAGISHLVTCKVTDSASTPVTSPASNAVSVTVNSALVAPTVSASLGTVTQGQTSSLTSSAVTTGTAPYTYQWFQRIPSGDYASVGSNSSNFDFVTYASTAIGSWSFILQVTDTAGQAVNSSAVAVTVNFPPIDHFIFSNLGVQTAGTYFSITITAKDASNNTLTNYNGSNSLNVSTGTINPTTTGVFSNGVWTGSVMVTQAGSGIWLITSGSDMSGVSNSFKVNPGVLDHFIFSAFNGTQTNGSSFNITVTAKDAYNNTVTSYNGKPSLTFSAGSISPTVMNAFIKGVGSTLVTINAMGSSGTISVQDGTHTGVSNSFTVITKPTSTQSAISFESMLAVAIAIPEIILVYTVIAFKRLKRKPENA